MSRSTLPRRADVRLSDGQLAVLREMLEEQRNFRLEQLAALRRPNARNRLGSRSREISVALTVGAQTALSEVVSALYRMDEGRYGRCERCGTAIGIERLEVLPQAALCMGCQRNAPG